MINEDVFDIEIELLIHTILLKFQYDFRGYSRASLKRRVLQALPVFQCQTVSDLQKKILYHPEEFSQLLDYLTVPTTEMFRDPSYFKAIRDEVVPYLKTFPSLKIWIAGCSSGEEIYSFAILLKEEGLLEKSLIYATDINPKMLEKAQRGIYEAEVIRTATLNYQRSGGKASFSDYYSAYYNAGKMSDILKEKIVFSDHSLSTDSSFAEVQFISCRNVLIYFDRQLQDRAVGLFKDSLVRGGILGIGSKESLSFSLHKEAFKALVEKEKIYIKI